VGRVRVEVGSPRRIFIPHATEEVANDLPELFRRRLLSRGKGEHHVFDKLSLAGTVGLGDTSKVVVHVPVGSAWEIRIEETLRLAALAGEVSHQSQGAASGFENAGDHG